MINFTANLASFKKPKIHLSQCPGAQTPNKPVIKQPTFIMSALTTQSQKAQFCCIATSSQYEN
jgi:hypothetical protein